MFFKMKPHAILFGLFCAASSLWAAVNSENSFFQVSTHEPAVNQLVQVKIMLFDNDGNPVNAKDVQLYSSVKESKITPAKLVKTGEYSASITLPAANLAADLSVIADDVTVLENILSDGGFEQPASQGNIPAFCDTYTSNRGAVGFAWDSGETFSGKKSLKTISLDEMADSYWGFAVFTGNHLIPGRYYIPSVYAKYENIQGERGVSMNIAQQDKNEKYIHIQYAPFRIGSGDWVKLEVEEFVPLKEAETMTISAIILHGAGRVWFDNARVRVKPTLIAGEQPGRTLTIQSPKNCIMGGDNYAEAIAGEIQHVGTAIGEAEKKYGEAALADIRKEWNELRAETSRKIDVDKALNGKLRAKALDAQLKQVCAALEQKNLRSALGGQKAEFAEIINGIPQKVYGKHIRATMVPKIDSKITVDGQLNESIWKNIATQDDFIVPSTGEKSQFPTKLAVAYDHENLYVAVDVTGTQQCIEEKRPKDSSGFWMGDTLEVFVGNPENPQAYKQFAITPANNQFDVQDGDEFLNFDWQSATKRSNDRWSGEIALPWKQLGIDPDKQKEIRFNVCRSHPMYRDERDEAISENSCWSLEQKGFREVAGFGFLLLEEDGKIIDRALVDLERQVKNTPMDQDATKFFADLAADLRRRQAGPAGFVDAKNQLTYGENVLLAINAANAGAELQRNRAQTALLASNWDGEKDFEKSKDFQTIFLSERFKKPDPASLKFKQAGNEFAHKSFILSAVKKLDNIRLTSTALKDDKGNVIPAEQVKIYRINYLEPAKEIWPDQYALWSGRPLPELVEEVDGPISLDEFQSAQFRVVVNSHDIKSGLYQGAVDVDIPGEKAVTIPVSCDVMNFELPHYMSTPMWIYVFSFLPWGGESGEAWAKLFKEHYVSDISFEPPAFFKNGEPLIPPDHIKNDLNYLNAILNSGIKPEDKITIDGNMFDIADRLRICAKYKLKPEMSNRSLDIYPEAFPVFVEFMRNLGFEDDGYFYKLGDEDTSAWLLPLAQKIKSITPSVPLAMIPSGNDYWDMKPLLEPIKHYSFTRGGLNSKPEQEADLRYMQKNGAKWARYTNTTSWTERDAKLVGRRDLWDVMIKDQMDGYQIWTAGIYAPLKYRLPYGNASKEPIYNWAPENQSNCQLIYVRKVGDFYKPISCIRLEDMRDGITDFLYYQEAQKRLQAAGDKEGLKKLQSIADMSKTTLADFESARNQMSQLILEKNK